MYILTGRFWIGNRNSSQSSRYWITWLFGTNGHLSDIVEIEERRRILGPIFKHAKSSGLTARLVSDRLYINSKLYTVDDLDTLPSLINPLTTSTQEHENTVAFWEKISPYSTFHEHVFLFQESQYYTVEQCLQHQKAMFLTIAHRLRKLSTRVILWSADISAKKLLSLMMRSGSQAAINWCLSYYMLNFLVT